MFCIHCGAKLAENSKFCPLCGNAVVSAVPPMSQPVVQPAPQTAAQPVYGAPVYSYPVYVMPAAPAQPMQPAQPVQPAAAPYAAPVSAAGGIPAYKQNPRPVQPTPEAPAAAAVSVAGEASEAAAESEAIVPEPQPEDTSALLTVWQTIVCFLALFCLPIGNIIFACVWGFRAGEHPQRRTLARAALPFIAIGLVALFCGLLWLVLNMNSISITIR